jgi:hypothetical protein
LKSAGGPIAENPSSGAVREERLCLVKMTIN